MNKVIAKSILFFSIGCFPAYGQPAPDTSPLATLDGIQTDLETVVCKNKGRLAAVRSLFVSKGATEEEIETEVFGKTKNLVVTIPGNEKEIVVVGAHYDKARLGCGVIDNWSGIVIISNLFKTIKAVETKKTWKFVAFGQEEEGLIGSKRMANAIPKEARTEYCLMVNFDSFGMGYPQAMGNISDGALVALAKEISKKLELPFGSAGVNGNSDSSAFRAVDIPAITFHGMNSDWRTYLHTTKDELANIKGASVYFGYRFGLLFAHRVESAGCREVPVEK